MMNWPRDETAIRKGLLILALVATAGPAPAQEYPTRPIKALTTTSAGGISDVFMRALGDELLKRWGQPIVVENRPGGMQNLGARACTEAPPDGYTICILNVEPIAYNQFLLKSMSFDPEKGLQPVTNLYHLIHILVVNSQLGVKTIDEPVSAVILPAFSLPSLVPSSSESRSRGLKPKRRSAPSLRPSRSVSFLRGFVCDRYSR